MSAPTEKTVGERLVSIETKLDSLLTHQTDQEKRLRTVERLLALAVAGGGIVAYLQGAGVLQ